MFKRRFQKTDIQKMNSKQLSCSIVLLVSFLIFGGCSPETRVAPDRLVVRGIVTLDGEPLKEGSIMFTSPEDIADGIGSSASIKDGVYEAKVTLGEKTVKINAVVVTGTAEVEGWEDTEELIPAKYNNETTLKASVGDNQTEFDFKLESN